MDFKSLISKIESIDGRIETPAAPKLADPILLNEDASLRVLAGVSALSEELKKVGDKTTTHKGGTVTKTATGVKHEKKDDYDGEDHSEPAQKKASKAGMTGAERREQKAADKAEEKKSKEWEKKHGKGSVTRHKMEDVELDKTKFQEKFSKMVEAKKTIKGKKAEEKMDEAKKPDANKDGIPDYAQDGKGAKDLGKGKKPADKDGEEKETKGLSAKQKKLPPGLQKAIAKKKGTSESVKTSKKVVAESVEQKLSLKDMLRIVKESGGQQQIDPVDQTLWSWANRVASAKIQESANAEIFAAMIYERNGGRFQMYDVLSESKKIVEYEEGERPKTDEVMRVLIKSGFSEEDVFGLLRFATSSGNQRDAGPNFRKMLKTLSAKGIDLFDIENA